MVGEDFPLTSKKGEPRDGEPNCIETASSKATGYTFFEFMMDKGNNNYGEALFLLAPGFEASTFTYCLDRMREAGIAVSVIGLTTGLVKSSHGLSVRPDYSLAQVDYKKVPRLIIIPDGQKSTPSLLADPRVHILLEKTLEKNGFIAAMATAESQFRRAGIPQPSFFSQFITQGDSTINHYTAKLIDLLAN